MAGESLRGLANAFSTLDALPKAAREELIVEMNLIGREESAAQKAAVAKASGFLSQGLSFAMMVERLRLKVGLVGSRRGRSDRYYGNFVERGRRAQTVLVTRGTRDSARSASTRRRQAAGLTVRKPYTLRVRPMAARPFVHRAGVEENISRRFADYWSKVLDRAGA